MHTTDSRTCLSIRQPWAWAILRPDITDPAIRAAAPLLQFKNIENRTWSTTYRGRLYIHAAKTIDENGVELLRLLKLPLPAVFQTAGLIGHVDLTAMRMQQPTGAAGIWFTGPIGWEVHNPTIIPFEPLRGYPGLFIAGNSYDPTKPRL